MSPSTTQASRLSPRGRLDAAGGAWLVVVIVGGGWIAAMAAIPGLPGIPCLVHAVTGFSCPGCGMTRACRALLLGDVRGALAWHPLVFFVAGFVVVHTARVLSGWWCGRAWPGPLPRLLAVALTVAFVAGFVAVAVDRIVPVVTAIAAAVGERSP